MHLLKGEDENKFGILIEDINKPHHERTDATNVMLSAVAKNIKVIASKIYNERKSANLIEDRK
jgi:hypothetical protein